MENQERPTYSVQVRLERTTLEDTYVAVPLSEDLWIEQSEGKWRINVPKMMARALEMGQASEIVWQTEEQTVRHHPIQKPKPAPEPTTGVSDPPD